MDTKVISNFDLDLISITGPGSFWEDRGDRFHMGVDIYAPLGSEIYAIYDAVVSDLGIFTDETGNEYWNRTVFLDLFSKDLDLHILYCEMKTYSRKFKIGDTISKGEHIGYIGQVLNVEKITEKSPLYIQKLKDSGNNTMLHLETTRIPRVRDKLYLGGNWFGFEKPNGIINPLEILKHAKS